MNFRNACKLRVARCVVFDVICVMHVARRGLYVTALPHSYLKRKEKGGAQQVRCSSVRKGEREVEEDDRGGNARLQRVRT